MANFLVTMKDNDTTAVLARPFVITQPDGTLEGNLEVLKYWKTGTWGVDADNPAAVTLPGVPDPASTWVYVVGGPLSRDFPELDPSYNFDGPIRTDEPLADVSWAYWTGYQAFLQSHELALKTNYPYFVQRHIDWVAQNPPSNDEAWVETPLPVESIPPWV